MTHYETLGIKPPASSAEIKTAWREAMRRHHPDTGDGDRAKLAAVQAAYEALVSKANQVASGQWTRSEVDDLREEMRRAQRYAEQQAANRRRQKVHVAYDIPFPSSTESAYRYVYVGV